MITLSFGRLCLRPECVVFLGVQGLHGLMFLILISRRFAFFKRLISAKPKCSGGWGGSTFLHAVMRRLAPSIYLSPPKISGISSTQKIFYPSLRIHKNIRVSPPLGSYTRWPSESDKTGVMKIATKERDIDNDVIVYIVIGDAYQIFQQSLSIKQSKSRQL